MKVIDYIHQLVLRFRYPVSLPKEVGLALGLPISSFASFDDLVALLSVHAHFPEHLKKFMPREAAEQTFHSALKIERFSNSTLCSYYFNEGWLEFNLQFDAESRLRRVYFLHKKIDANEGIEIPLSKE